MVKLRFPTTIPRRAVRQTTELRVIAFSFVAYEMSMTGNSPLTQKYD